MQRPSQAALQYRKEIQQNRQDARIFLIADLPDGCAGGLIKRYMIFARPQRILVVEDEDMVLKVVLRLLQHHGFEATGAHDGAEAIALTRDVIERGEPFSAVIVDSNLPNGLSGRETLKILRRLDASMRAILTSGDLTRIALVADPSYDAVVPKPFEMESLRRTLVNLLAQPPRQTAA